MNTDDRRPDQHEHDRYPGHSDTAADMMGMMAIMMAMCLGMVLLFAIIPAVGLPAGLTIAAAGAAIMLVVHARMMRHGKH